MKKIFANKQIQTTLFMTAGLITGLFVYVFNVIGLGFDYFPGDLGDGRLNLYFLEHAHLFFTGKLVDSFWNAPFMFPETNVIAYSDNLLGSAPIYSLFRLLGCDTFFAYQLWFIAVSLLNYITAFYFIKYIFKNNFSALLGAFIFAFSISLQSQITHAQMFPRFAIPLTFLWAVKFSENLQLKYLFYSLLFLVYQIYCGVYLGFLLAIPLGIFFVVILAKSYFSNLKNTMNTKWWLFVIGIVITNVLILLPLMLPYMGKNIRPSLEHYKSIVYTIPTIESYLFSHRGSLVWGFISNWAKYIPSYYNHQIFSGVISIICFMLSVCYLGYYLIKNKFHFNKLTLPLILILTGFITFILFLRFGSISAYVFIYILPGFTAMRSLARIINIELLFFGISVAFIFSKTLSYNIKFKKGLLIIVFGLFILDNAFYADKVYKTKVDEAKQRCSSIENIFAQIPINNVVSFEPNSLKDAAIYYQIDAMLTAQKYGLKSVNGYTATCPGMFGKYWNNPNEENRNIWLKNKPINKGLLYVVHNRDSLSTVDLDSICQYNPKQEYQNEIKNMMDYIRSDKKWFDKIKEKAIQKNISVDSMLFLDAKWIVDKN